ncbi:MAG: hypothetical protein IK137_00780 [Bacilli bacterium]|nr:hypothetical protein [Bacilli bacterium]
MTTLVLKKEEFEKLVEKYYEEIDDIKGKATAISKVDSDNWYQPLVKLNGSIEMGGSEFKIERAVGIGTLKEIIRYYYEGVENITFNLKEGVFENITIQIKGKVKKK